MKLLSPFTVILAIGVFGFLVLVPLAGHLITRNDVERELETALVDYQTLPRERFRARVDRIVRENRLAGLASVSIDEPGADVVVVTIRYPSRMHVLLVPVTLDVVVSKTTRRLGV